MIAILDTEPELGPQKRCPRCQEWWPADAEFFHRRTASRDGLQPYCRACWHDWTTYGPQAAARRAYGRDWHQRNRATQLAHERERLLA